MKRVDLNVWVQFSYFFDYVPVFSKISHQALRHQRDPILPHGEGEQEGTHGGEFPYVGGCVPTALCPFSARERTLFLAQHEIVRPARSVWQPCFKHTQPSRITSIPDRCDAHVNQINFFMLIKSIFF